MAKAKPKAGTAQLKAVAKRFGITAREARDIATAVGTVARVAKEGRPGSYGGLKEIAESGIKSGIFAPKSYETIKGRKFNLSDVRRRAFDDAKKDLKRQVKETVRAAKTGQKGRTAGKIGYQVDSGLPREVKKGKKRK